VTLAGGLAETYIGNLENLGFDHSLLDLSMGAPDEASDFVKYSHLTNEVFDISYLPCPNYKN